MPLVRQNFPDKAADSAAVSEYYGGRGIPSSLSIGRNAINLRRVLGPAQFSAAGGKCKNQAHALCRA
jgi:hypothetical protein